MSCAWLDKAHLGKFRLNLDLRKLTSLSQFTFFNDFTFSTFIFEKSEIINRKISSKLQFVLLFKFLGTV